MPPRLFGRVKETPLVLSEEVSDNLKKGELFQRSEVVTFPVVRTLNTYPRLHRTKLKQISDSEIDSWTKGVDILWMMGMQKRSSVAVAHAKEWAFQYEPIIGSVREGDIVGSAFAVQAFLPDAALVENAHNWDEVREFRKKLNKKGKKLYGDIVFHAVAPDHPWTKAHPDWFICATERQFQERPGDFFTIHANDGKDYHIAKGRSSWDDIAWADLAQLNLANPQTQQALSDVARVYGKTFDGGRIDMAMLLSPFVFEDIWGGFLTSEQKKLLHEQKADIHKQLLPQVINAAKQGAAEGGRSYHTIAETYSIYGQDENLLQSVDNIYEKGWYDHFLRVIREGASLPELARCLNENMKNIKRGVLFTGNHDEPPPVYEFRFRKTNPRGEWEQRSHSLGVESSLAALAIISLLPSGSFLLDDTQQEGYDGGRVPMQVGRLPSFEKDHYVEAFSQGVLSLKHTKLFQTGIFDISPTKYREGQQQFDLGHPAILPLRVQSQDQTEGVVVCSNFSESRQGCLLPVNGAVDIEVFDMKRGRWLPQKNIDQNRNGGFIVVLDGYQVQLVHYKKR